MRKRFIDLRMQSLEAVRNIGRQFAELRPDIRAERLRDLRSKLRDELLSESGTIRNQVTERLQSLHKEIEGEWYPGFLSSDTNVRLLASMEVAAGRNHPKRFDVKGVENALALGRREYVAGMMEVADSVPENSLEAVTGKVRFMDAVRNLLGGRVRELEAERRDLRSLSQELDLFDSQVRDNLNLEGFPTEILSQEYTLSVKE